MNTKGFVRTLEAVIAIVILLGAVLILIPEEQPVTGEVPAEIQDVQSYVLQEIALNKNYRDCVTTSNAGYEGKCQGGCLTPINDFIISKIPFGYTGVCELCNSAISCTNMDLPIDKSIYTDSIFLVKPPVTKVLRVYFYEK